MSKGFWILTVRGGFSSAHALRHYQGKCENLHGHNYQVEMSVRGNSLTEDTELLVDFTVLKQRLNEELDLLDHKNLNEFPPFDQINPSAENLARYLFKRLQDDMKAAGVDLRSVTVSENVKQSATYQELED